MATATHLVCFRIGKETYGVDIFAVREIVKAQEITSIPGTASYVLGIINLRGKIVSVVDLAARLNLGATQMIRTSRILVVDIEGLTVGFLVDAATEVLKLPVDAIEPAPDELKTSIHEDHLEGVGIVESRLVIILNLGHLLSESETEAIGSAVEESSAGAVH